ncbi:MAG TPA: NADH-quinone oxidoreductase subunit L, partial [Pontibacter sp.]
PLTSGFLSKDAILSVSWAWAQTLSANGNLLYFIVPVTGFVVVVLTAYYMTRHMWFMFFGSFRAPFDVQQIRHTVKRETERVMLLPVILLAVLSLGIFFSLNPLSFSSSWVVNGISIKHLSLTLLAESLVQAVTIQDNANHLPHILIGVASALLAAAGIIVALVQYNRKTSAQLLREQPATTFARSSYNHFYLDTFFRATFVRPAHWMATTLYRVDKRVIDYTLNYGSKWLVVFSKIISWFDRLVVDGMVWLVAALSKAFGYLGRNLQNGKVQSYYAYSLFGFILIILYIVLF